MSKGTYEDFRDALRAFESGWDRDRYDQGVIQDWQLDSWAGGTVTDFYPGYTSWGDLSDAEWDAMSYRSMNSLGFVGYQFGEALLIDLGYYDDDVFYGAGASTNTWDGTWTGKNGVDSLDAFMTAEAQEVAIQEAFGYNLKIIRDGLTAQGLSLEDFIGTTTTYVDNGTAVAVELSLTGIMAAAHLRGAYGTLNLLLNGSVSTDEYGTSILRYIDQFGGYDSPGIDEAIAFFEDRRTGDEGLGTPDGDGGTGDTGGDDTHGDDPGAHPIGTLPPGNGTANVTKDTADVVITWSWGSTVVLEDFDPAADTIFIDWIGADALDIVEYATADGGYGTTFAIPSNNQMLSLDGVRLADLTPANFTILDSTAAAKVLSMVSSGNSPDGGDGGTDDGDSDGDGHGGHGDHGMGDDGNSDDDGHMGGHTHMHVLLTSAAPAQIIDGFMPAMGDVIEFGPDLTAEAVTIFEESGDALGQTVRIEISDGADIRQIVFTGFGLDDLSLGNFSITDQALLNEVAAAIGSVLETPGDGGGYELNYDSDGSNPPDTTGTTDAGGVKYKADSNADDIVGFRPGTDQLDFGGTSVHGMIVTKSLAGEVVIDSPWSAAAQIVQGVTYGDVTIDDFGIVGNEHFRQDMGGVVSWEQGIGPRDSDTIYIRSHEYGVHEVIDGFDPTSMKISFFYFGTRERLEVTDTDQGLVISSLPSGQSTTLTGVTTADLIPGLVEFHFDQVMEDNLETPFGFDQNDVTLVDRSMLLTPAAPAGASTDGFQTRTGDLTGSIYEDTGGDTGDDPGNGDGDAPSGDPSPEGSDVVTLGAGADSFVFGWSYGTATTVRGFDTNEDMLDFGTFSDGQLAVFEQDGNLVFEVLDNGGDFVVIEDIQAEDLRASNLTAPDWNAILDNGSAMTGALTDLGFDGF
ncbi:MAG: 1,4-beta-glucanase [Pseudomonadota bacterium]